MAQSIRDSDGEIRTPRTELTIALAEGGMEDFHIISEETAREVLTDRRREILDILKREDVESVRGLARTLGRDKAAVSRDLATLAEKGLITYEENGRAKQPVLRHERVIVEPLL